MKKYISGWFVFGGERLEAVSPEKLSRKAVGNNLLPLENFIWKKNLKVECFLGFPVVRFVIILRLLFISNAMKSYLILFLAIVFETVATSFMKQSEQFTKLIPAVVTIVGYIGAFYCLSIVMKTIPVGIAYAIWSGVGIILITLIGLVVFKQHLDLAAFIGLGFIIAGVIIINVFSHSVSH